MMRRSLIFTTMTLVSSMFTFAQSINTNLQHGYVQSPPSRAYLCSSFGGNANKNCGVVQYDPHSIEGKKGFPEAGPPDGEIASGGKSQFAELNQQSSDRWSHVKLKPGPQTFHWFLTAKHRTASWKFYMTKPGWDPEKPLTRDSFNLVPFCEQDDGGAMPSEDVYIKCNVPNQPGYHAILATWDIDDTANAFYQVIDVDMEE